MGCRSGELMVLDLEMCRRQVPPLQDRLGHIRDVAALVVLTLEIDDTLDRIEGHHCDEFHLGLLDPPWLRQAQAASALLSCRMCAEAKNLKGAVLQACTDVRKGVFVGAVARGRGGFLLIHSTAMYNIPMYQPHPPWNPYCSPAWT